MTVAGVAVDRARALAGEGGSDEGGAETGTPIIGEEVIPVGTGMKGEAVGPGVTGEDVGAGVVGEDVGTGVSTGQFSHVSRQALRTTGRSQYRSTRKCDAATHMHDL